MKILILLILASCTTPKKTYRITTNNKTYTCSEKEEPLVNTTENFVFRKCFNDKNEKIANLTIDRERSVIEELETK